MFAFPEKAANAVPYQFKDFTGYRLGRWYIFKPTGEPWPKVSVDAILPKVKVGDGEMTASACDRQLSAVRGQNIPRQTYAHPKQSTRRGREGLRGQAEVRGDHGPVSPSRKFMHI